MLDLQPAVAKDADSLFTLREQAARWLQARDIRQWVPGEVSPATFGAQVAAGEWFVDRWNEGIRAALRFCWSDPDTWGMRPPDAGYVHGLMVDRDHAGEGLGGQLLDWAEYRTIEAGRRLLRLDCVEGNQWLRRYYGDRGFHEVGRKDFEGSWFPAVLLEKALD